MRFKVPFFVTNHAVERFQKYVENIPAAEVIESINLRLQDPGEPVQWEVRCGWLIPLFRWMYIRKDGRQRICYIPVVPGDGEWPAVPTILGSNSPLHKDLNAGRAKRVYVKGRKVNGCNS